MSGAAVSFSTSNSAIATVSTLGEVNAVAVGTATISATADGKVGTSAITVTDVAVGTVTVTLAHTDLLKVSDTVRATAVVRDAQGNILQRSVVWSTSNPAVALITPAGLILGLSPGGPIIVTATAGGQTGTAALGVVPAAVGAVVVTPDSANLVIGTTVQLNVQVFDEFGALVTDRPVSWTSLVPTVASVSSSGLVSALAVGQTQILVNVEGVNRSVFVAVSAVPVAMFRVQVTNYLQYPLEILVNDVPVGTIPESSVGTVEPPLLPLGLVSWRLMSPAGRGEVITDTLGTVRDPTSTSVYSYIVDNVLHDGTTYFRPVIRNLSSAKVLLDFPVRTRRGALHRVRILVRGHRSPRHGLMAAHTASVMNIHRASDATYHGAKITIRCQSPSHAARPVSGRTRYWWRRRETRTRDERLETRD